MTGNAQYEIILENKKALKRLESLINKILETKKEIIGLGDIINDMSLELREIKLEKDQKFTLENYLRDNYQKNIIDFSMRIIVEESGSVKFYIHPDGKDGETLDFEVSNNELLPI